MSLQSSLTTLVQFLCSKGLNVRPDRWMLHRHHQQMLLSLAYREEQLTNQLDTTDPVFLSAVKGLLDALATVCGPLNQASWGLAVEKFSVVIFAPLMDYENQGTADTNTTGALSHRHGPVSSVRRGQPSLGPAQGKIQTLIKRTVSIKLIPPEFIIILQKFKMIVYNKATQMHVMDEQAVLWDLSLR